MHAFHALIPSLSSRARLSVAALLLVALLASGTPAPSALAASPAAAATSPTDPGASSALVLEAGSIARRQLVAVGRDVEVRGEAWEDVAAFNGTVRVSGTVKGDVIVLGGGAELASSARIGGDVFALGGPVKAAPGAEIAGKTVAYPDASAVWITLIEGPAVGLPATSPLVLGGKLALIAAWLVLTLVFFSASGRQMLSTSAGVAAAPFRSFFVGILGVLALTLTTVLFSAFAAALVGLPLLVLAALLALVLKLWGMVAVFHALGDWLSRRVLRKTPRSLNAATIGLVVLGVLKLLPYVGIWAWSIATFIGVGAALSTKFGRREPWFAPT